jgi:hypothetical protein
MGMSVWKNVKMSHTHLYHEGEAETGPRETCFWLLDYIINHISETVKELHFISDSFHGQNKPYSLSGVARGTTVVDVPLPRIR